MIDNLILQFDTAHMERKRAHRRSVETRKLWQATQYSNLIRYVPSGTFFARLRIGGNLIRKSLQTDMLAVAKLRLGDLEKSEREAVEMYKTASKGRMTFGDCVGMYKAQSETSRVLKSSAKRYRNEVIKSILKSWPGLEVVDVRQISVNDCNNWAARFSTGYSATRFNGAVGVLRAILNVAVANNALFRNPAMGIKRAKVRSKSLVLPEPEQFERFVAELDNGGGRDSQNCADLVRFLAFGGFRKSEAANITWADCNFDKGEILVRGDPETGTKNWSVRRVPMISDMIQLLQKLRGQRRRESVNQPVMRVRECQKAMDRAVKAVGLNRITHHDLRHLFATRCIESGVDIPTVSRWLGHKDGGALAMKVYGHLRDQHSVSMAKRVTFSTGKANNIVPMRREVTK